MNKVDFNTSFSNNRTNESPATLEICYQDKKGSAWNVGKINLYPDNPNRDYKIHKALFNDPKLLKTIVENLTVKFVLNEEPDFGLETGDEPSF